MASAATIGALRVILGGDASGLQEALDKSAVRLGAFAGIAAGVASELTKGLVRGIENVAGAIPRAIEGFDSLGKSAQKIGVPVEELSALKHVADLSDVSMEGLQKSFGKLAKSMVEAAAKPTSDAANAFNALGISSAFVAKNLNSPSTVMTEIAGKFEGLKDGAGKTAVAMALFGKSGADLIPLLNSGKEGLAGMIAEARELGITIDTKTAKSAEAFNDNLTRLAAVKNGIIVQLSAKMLPALEALSQKMIDAAKSGGVVETVSGVLVKGFEVLARGVMLVADNIGLIVKIGAVFIGAQIGAAVIGMAFAFSKLALAVYTTGVAMTLFNAIKNLSLKGLLLIAGVIALASGQFDTLKDKLTEIGSAFTSMLPDEGMGGIVGMMKDLGINIRALDVDLKNFGKGSGEAGKGQQNFNYALMGGKSAVDSFLDSQKKSLAGQQAELQTTGLAAGAKERLKVVLQGLQIATANNIPITDGLRAKLTEAGNAAELMALKLANMSLLTESNPLVTLGLQLDATNAKLREGGIAAQDYAMLSEQAGLLTQKIWQDSAASLGGSFESIGSSMSQMSDNWVRLAKVGQAIGATVAFVNAYVAASEAFAKTPFPANIAVAAGVLAKGITMVAAIKGAAVPTGGFATAGAITVPGGMGGGDRVRAMVDLEPGEQLDIWRPGEAGADPRRGAGGGQMTVVQVHMDAISRGVIGPLIERINEAVRDGYRLEVA